MGTTELTPSKKQVTRAGKLMARFIPIFWEDRKRAFHEFDVEEVLKADAVVEWWRREHAYPLRKAAANLRYYTLEIPGASTPTSRLKKTPTIIDKLIREPKMALATMEDIGGCRVVVPDQLSGSRVTARLRKNWTIRRFRNYVEEPKNSGYRALHLIVTKDGRAIEVQIRTLRQDRWANEVEQASRRRQVDFKSGAGAAEVHAYYSAMADLFAMQDRGETADIDFRNRLLALQEAAMPYLSRPRRSS